jgi:hypothetical protein
VTQNLPLGWAGLRRPAQAPKIGLFDYVLGIARNPAYRSRIRIVPVAVNYDRVLQDRCCCAVASRRYAAVACQAVRSDAMCGGIPRGSSRRWKRYGRAR